MQILNFWILTYSQETKDHTAQEPGGHGRVGQRRLHPEEALEGVNRGAGVLVPVVSTRWRVTWP